ncbi:MAG: glycogen debranching protein GlgX [Actinomycetota bacterium]|nr:glycogen debranching protein GlgX [Actinomycetota bacterium]
MALGSSRSLGAHWDGQGTNFAVFSSAGAYDGEVELCLLDEDGGEQRVALHVEQDVWHGYLPGIGPGQRYGFRASGPFTPARGLRFDDRRLLADPYARALEPVGPREVRSLVVDEHFDWGADRPPDRPWSDTILYETHVQGISITHPDVAAELRGTYAGLASPPIVEHLVGLGVSAVELLPVHHFLSEQRLLDLGLTNYWGYSTLGFFAPHAAYRVPGSAPGSQVTEFKSMVKGLHKAGLEVILDVVYNHTAEGGPGGSAVAFRGLANEVYYRLDPADPARYVDTTGTGNVLNVDRPEVLRMIMDSLRYWVTEMHVDGFRFDLAATLARDSGSFDRLAAFFDLVFQDPVINMVKLIAEPWDVGRDDSYQVGRFPRGWTEWNDHYRDDVRDFWRRRAGVRRLGYRLTGSSDLYGADRRGPDTSVNFVTAHDGKTLTDLVSYERKHNEANGEGNRDGATDDRAENFGVEGPTDDPQIVADRVRQRRNLMATLLLSQGVPMLLGGDERGRTQRGNNNAYCQANEISWYDWSADPEADRFAAFTRHVVALHREHPTLRRRSFFDGSGDPPDIAWYDAAGQPMTVARWGDPDNHFIAYLLAGGGSDFPDDDLLVVLNADVAPAAFVVPGAPGQRFTLLLHTGHDDGRPPAGGQFEAGARLDVPPRAVLVAAAPR